jgi:diacylglycerol kinase family enzyme
VSAPLTVFANRKAGSWTDATRERIESALRRAGLEARVVAHEPRELRAAGETAAGEGHTLVAAGGDGTVSMIAAAAVRHGARFGVIPLGTLNHFAKDAGIPLDLDAAVGVLATGREAAFDAAGINGRVFVNNASAGFYARIVRERQIEQREGHRKWTAFAIGLARTWLAFRQMTVRLTVDGAPRVVRTPFVFVGNGRYVEEGTGLGSRAALDTGRLAIYVAPECGRADMLGLLVRALAGRLTPDVPLEHMSAEEVTIEPAAHHVPLAIDGELVTERAPLRCQIHAGALRTLVPAAG